MKLFLLLLLTIPLLTAAQVKDSVYSREFLRINAVIDSLKGEILLLKKDIQTTRRDTLGDVEFDKLLTSPDEDNELIPKDQRSSNKRLDALLEVITNRPGQIKLNGAAVSVIHNKFTGNRNSSAVGFVDLYTTTSFGGESIFFIFFQAKGGNGLDEHLMSFVSADANAGSTQSDEGLDVVAIPEAWAEFSIIDNDIIITAGKIDLTNYFDNNNYANDEYSQFITSGFVNSSALPFNEQTPGIRIRSTILNRFFIQLAVVNSSNSGDKIFKSLLRSGSVGFKVFPETVFEANLRIYGYIHPRSKSKAGYGISFDQNLFDLLGLFARWNKNHDNYSLLINIKEAWSAGLVYRNSFLDRKFTCGIAFGKNSPFNKNLSAEYNAELYTRFQMNKWVSISPHLQKFWNVGGSSKNIYLGALKAQINF